jgi:hypothetical protein
MGLMDDIEIEEQQDSRQDQCQSTASSSLVAAPGDVEEGGPSSGLDLLAMVSTPSTLSVVFTAHNAQCRHVIFASAAQSRTRSSLTWMHLHPRSPGFASPPPSVLQRRQREPDTIVWSRNQKTRFSEFATAVCAEYDVPEAEKGDVVEKSQAGIFALYVSCPLTPRQLSTHELLITLYARLARDQNQASDSSGQAWLKSPQYKVDSTHQSRDPLV